MNSESSRLVVFGSLVHRELFHLRSDIDLGVWDIQNYFPAVSRLMDLDPEFEFDLVPIPVPGSWQLSPEKGWIYKFTKHETSLYSGRMIASRRPMERCQGLQ